MVLQTLHGEIIGVIGNYFNLDVQIKFADVSQISFEVPAYDNGVKTEFYNDIQAYRIVQIDPYGLYVLEEPNTSGDGIREVKEVSASSIEILLSNKRIVLEEGTYPLYSAADLASSTPSTIMGIVHQIAPDWNVQVDDGLGTKYRTFDQTDDSLLDWLRGVAAKSYGCVFDIDPYTKTIHVIDALKDYDVVPIYLSYENLLKSQDINVSIDDFFTVLKVSGADPVDIREVNPIGTDKIYNLNYFLENGDIEEPLATKFRAWQDEIYLERDLYTSMYTLYNTSLMRKTIQEAKIKDLEGEVGIHTNSMDVIMDMINKATTASVKEQQEEDYADAKDQYDAAKAKLDDALEELEQIEAEIADHRQAIVDIVDELKYENYFTAEEQDILAPYLIESDFSDESFATFDVDISATNDSYAKSMGGVMQITGESEDDVVEIDMSQIDTGNIIDKRIFLLNGGTFTVTVDNVTVSGKILSGTFEQGNTDKDVVCSIYSGYGTISKDGGETETQFVNANITITADDATFTDLDDVEFDTVALYFTKNVTQFESYAVQRELYDHAVEQHETIAYPGCQFNIQSGNILFAKEFEKFKDVLTPGTGVYLELSDNTLLTPLLLEVHFSYEDPTDFDLIFSNTFSRHDNVTNMKKLLEEARRTSRSLDMAKYNYGAFRKNGAESEVRALFTQGLDVATRQILAGVNNSVVIDGTGITISNPDDPTVILRMNNGMFAFMDENNRAQLAIGKFYDTGMGQTMYGIVAPNIVGTLLAGENLIIQSPKMNGTDIMFFSVDANGVRLANGQFDIYKFTSQSGGLSVAEKSISIDPNLGILGGDLDNAIAYDQNTGDVAGVKIMNGSTLVGTVTSIADAKANYTNSIQYLTPNFWLDLNGDAFFRGTIYATDGYFSGTVNATSGNFTGSLNAATLNGDLTAGAGGGAIKGTSIGIGGTNYNNFIVDSNGNVTMNGNIVLNGNITWGDGANIPGSGEYDDFVADVNAYMSANDAALLLMQKELDGQIETYFYSYAPTLNNIPASEWTTDALKAQHEGDLFYDKSTGNGYRFVKNNGTYQWVQIGDATILQALAAAAEAQDTADGKRRNFINTPTPPYDVGDIWMDGSKILVCIRAKAAGESYSLSDWEERVAYTDDSTAIAIANGTYTGGTFINGTTIFAPQIYGGAILGVGSNPNATNGYNFYVDSSGNVWLQGNIHMLGVIDWGSNSGSSDYDALAGQVSNMGIVLQNYIQQNGAEVAGLRDKMVETYYYEYAPTLNNIPASEWDQDSIRASHVGDLFFDKSTGYTYRFNDTVTEVEGTEVTTYSWDRIEDEDIVSAMSAASNAQAAADGKIRHFTSTPYPPYDEGDIWSNGSDLYVCTTPKTSSGSYAASDWVKATDYTNDAVAQSIANGTYTGGTFISGTTITAPHIYGSAILGVGANGGSNADESKNYNFYVDSSGNVTMRGSITLDGNITWGTGTSPTQVVYARGNITKPTNGTPYTNYQATSSTAWHRTFDSANDYYASYTYDGGATWTSAVKIRGSDGAPGSSANVTRANIIAALHDASTNTADGIYRYTLNGSDYIAINASYIKTGTLSADRIATGTLDANNITTRGHFTFKYNPDYMGEITYGTMGQYSGSTTDVNNNNITTYGTAMYGKDNNFLITCTDYGARMSNDTSDTRVYVDENHAVLSSLKGPQASVSVNNAGGVVVSGTTFTWNSAAVSTSDIRRKHDISYDMEKYIPFILALKTARFKYNDGTSNRFHSGFVAQDVKNALDEAGLTTQEFAGYVSVNEIDNNGEVSGTYLGLRYEEFISLNTYMIQKLYARIEELENQISLLSGGNE